MPSFRSIFPLPTPYSGRGRPFRSVSALSFVPPSPIFRPCTGHLGPSLHSFRPIFLLAPLILARAGHLGPSLHSSPILHPCTLSPLILAGAGHLGPSLPSFRLIFHLATSYSGRGRPFRSVSALSFVPPSPIFHPCTLSPLILAGAGHLGPSLPSFRSIFLSAPLILAGAGHLGPSLPFRSSHLLPFPTLAPCHPLFWQGPAI